MNYTAYTYSLTFKPTGQLYYGVRYSRNRKEMQPEKDLWHEYFTSSTAIHKLIEEHGLDSFSVTIDKTFDSAEDAIAYEKEYLAEHIDDSWLNGNIAGAVLPREEYHKKISEFHKGVPKTKEHKHKISEANKGKVRPYAINNLPQDVSGKNNGMYGKKHGEQTLEKMRLAKLGKPAHNKGKAMTEEQKQKLSLSMQGKKHSEETIEKIRAANRGKKRPTKTCTHCGKTVADNIYGRYHGDKCKLNTML